MDEAKDAIVIKGQLNSSNTWELSSMIREQGDKSDRVATFLAILELIQSGRISFERCDDDYVIRLNLKEKGA